MLGGIACHKAAELLANSHNVSGVEWKTKKETARRQSLNLHHLKNHHHHHHSFGAGCCPGGSTGLLGRPGEAGALIKPSLIHSSLFFSSRMKSIIFWGL